MSNTPRTDQQEFNQECNFDVDWAGFARTLERDNNQLVAQRILDDGNIARMQEAGAKAEVTIEQLRASLKRCAVALVKSKQWVEVDSTEACICNISEHCSYCSKATYTLSSIDKALSDPLVQAALKEPHANT